MGRDRAGRLVASRPRFGPEGRAGAPQVQRGCGKMGELAPASPKVASARRLATVPFLPGPPARPPGMRRLDSAPRSERDLRPTRRVPVQGARRLPLLQHPPDGRGRRPSERRGAAAPPRAAMGPLAAEAVAALPAPRPRARRSRPARPAARDPHPPAGAQPHRPRRGPARRRLLPPPSKARPSTPTSTSTWSSSTACGAGRRDGRWLLRALIAGH
jgi:hypothetical protein